MPKMNLNNYPTRAYSNKPANRLIQNKPNQTQFQTQYLNSLIRVPYTLRGPFILPLFPDKADFSFDLAALPDILNAKTRQLHRPMRSEQFEQFKARKETYHVY